MAHTKHGKTPISRSKPTAPSPLPTGIQNGVFVYSVQHDSKEPKLCEDVCKEGGSGAAQLAWDDTDDADMQHDDADLDAARGLMILSRATAIEAATAATPILATNFGIEDMILALPATGVEAQKRNLAKPKKIVNAKTTDTKIEKKATRTGSIERVQREELRRPKRTAKMALEEFEKQDSVDFGVGYEKADVQLNNEDEDEDEEMSDEADEDFSPTARGRRNKQRKISSSSDVEASSRLSRSPVKLRRVRRIGGFQGDARKSVTWLEPQWAGSDHDVDEDGITSVIQSAVLPIHVQKEDTNVRSIFEKPGKAIGQTNHSTRDLEEPAHFRRVPSSGGNVSAVNNETAIHSKIEGSEPGEQIDPGTAVGPDRSTGIDVPTPTKAGKPKQAEERRYTGKWTMITTGPLKDDKEAQKSPVAKNDSSRPEDKAWTCEHHPMPKTRAKALREGIDVDDAAATVDYLTLRLTLKKDPETSMEIKYGPPKNWDDQKEMTALIKVITQHRRRFAGVKKETRHAYKLEEKEFLAKYFEDYTDLRGPKGMSRNEQWEDLAAAFNAQFKGRKSKIASKGGADVEVPERSWHAIMALCERDGQILKARRVFSAAQTTLKGKKIEAQERMVAEQEDTNEEGDEEVMPMPMPKKRACARVDGEEMDTPKKRARTSKAG